MKLLRILLCCAFSVLIVSNLTGETVFGGESVTSFLGVVDEPGGNQLDIGDDLHFYVNSYQDAFTFSSDISISAELLHDSTVETSVQVNTLFAEFYLGDEFVLKAGDYVEYGGSANLLSPLNLFHSTNPENLFKGDLDHILQPEHLIKLAWLSDSLSIDCIVAPLITPPSLVPVDSIWFPVNQFPAAIELVSKDLLRGDISYEDASFSQDSLDDMSVQARISGNTMSLDWSLLGFYGYDRDIANQILIGDLADADDTYDVYLIPIEAKKAVIGASVSTTLGELGLHSDITYTFGKVLGTEWLHFTGSIFSPDAEQEMTDARVLNYVAGVDLDMMPLRTFCTFEVHGMKAYTDEDVLLPMYSRVLSFMTNTVSEDYTLSLNTVSLISLEDSSGVFYLSGVWDPSSELSVSVSLPFFFGDEDSEFGQYSGRGYPIVKGVIRF